MVPVLMAAPVGRCIARVCAVGGMISGRGGHGFSVGGVVRQGGGSRGLGKLRPVGWIKLHDGHSGGSRGGRRDRNSGILRARGMARTAAVLFAL